LPDTKWPTLPQPEPGSTLDMSTLPKTDTSKVTVTSLLKFKEAGEKFTMLTAYDASFASVVDQAGVDLILVGDSLGMVIQGHDSTVPVKVEDILYHTRCVSRSCQRAMVMADMPFMSFRDVPLALENATRFMQEGGAQAVKLEGGGHVLPVVEALANYGIPVCAHLGLQPQYVNKLGGYRVQGRDKSIAKRMLQEAKTMQDSGADMLVLECVPAGLAQEISQSLTIPTIGIGAGVDCDAQVLVLYDLLGISFGKVPKFARDFLAGADSIQSAVEAYVKAVKAGTFPAAEHTFN